MFRLRPPDGCLPTFRDLEVKIVSDCEHAMRPWSQAFGINDDRYIIRCTVELCGFGGGKLPSFCLISMNNISAVKCQLALTLLFVLNVTLDLSYLVVPWLNKRFTYCILAEVTLVMPQYSPTGWKDHSDWLEGAVGPRQSGASTRAPRRGELFGGRRPPNCECLKMVVCVSQNSNWKCWEKISHFRAEN